MMPNKEEWFKSLAGFPFDRLRFEYEKRQSEINQVQMELAGARRELDALNEWDDRQREANPALYESQGSYVTGNHPLYYRLNQLEGRINELRDEMAAIEQVLNAKWK